MARPFRYEPPTPPPGMVPRPRLLAAVGERFERRLVVVVAGPGFGKTVLLASAIAGGGQGIDAWLSCEPADESAEHLLAGLATALGLPAAGGHPDVGDVVAAVGASAPRPVCLVLDDVHEVPRGSSGAGVLKRLLDELPGNGHVALGSRHGVPVPVARLAAAGQLVRLREDDLLLTGDELAAFAAARGVEPALLDGTGGWPALAELTASAGSDLVLDYLWEEVLDRLGPERSALLARLAAVGGGDAEVAAGLEGHAVDLDGVLDRVPLVARSADGSVAVHPLWQPALRRILPPAEADEARLRAAEVHRRRGRWAPAVDLLAEAEAWDELVDVIREVTRRWRAPVGPAELARWRRLLPARRQREPEALLVAGLEQQAAAPLDAVPLLEAAAEAFRARGDADGETMALAQLGLVRWWSVDLAALHALEVRIGELADAGCERARAVRAVGVAAVAQARIDPDAVLGLLDELGETSDLPDDWAAVAHWLRSSAHLQRGELGLALSEADAALGQRAGLFAPTIETTRRRIAWLDGHVEEAVDGYESELHRYEQVGSRQNVVISHLRLAFSLAWLGDPAAARRHLEAAEPLLATVAGPLMPINAALGRAACAVAEGDEPAAARLAAEVGRAALDSRQYERLAMVHVLVPSTREAWRDQPLGPAYLPGLRLAEALAASRDGDLDPVGSLAWPPAGVVRAHLGTWWGAELAAAGVAAGNPPPEDLLAQLGAAARPPLRALTTGSASVAAASRKLLAQLPAVPAYRLRIAVVGPLELWRDGEPVSHPDLRRERVRELLCFLVVHRRTRREEIAAALWPDLDHGGRNLRTTLNYLQRVLQPERTEGDPPWFVRQDGPWLRLGGEDHLEVDAWELEDLLDRAQADDDPAAYRAALPLWRGDHLADIPYVDWAEPHRARLRARYVAAALRLAELSLAGGDAAAADDAAAHALRADPWSEPAHRLRVRALLARGDRAAARAALDACRTTLAELGVEPEPATIALANDL